MDELTRKRSQLETELRRYEDVEKHLRERLERSETRCRELEQRHKDVCRRQQETIAKLTEVGKKLERLGCIFTAEKQLTTINQRKFRREIDSLRQQLTEATDRETSRYGDGYYGNQIA